MATFLCGFEEKGIKSDRPEDQLSKEKKKILFSFCEVCNIQLNSAAQAQVHYNGKSHRKRVKQLSDGQPPPPAPSSGLLLASSPGSNTNAVMFRGFSWLFIQELTPGGAQGTIWNAGDRTQVDCVQVRCPAR